MAVTQNFTMDQGADFERTLRFEVATVPIDLTGYSFRGQARDGYLAKTEAFDFIFVLKNQTTNTGEVSMTVSAVSTEALKLSADKAYVYDIERIDPSGKVKRIMMGQITVKPEATK